MTESNYSVRKAEPDDASGIARVHVDTWRTTYRGIVPEDFLSNLSVEQRQQYWHTTISDSNSQTAAFVAETNSKDIVGFAACGPDRDNDPIYKGELYAIYVLQKNQGTGIGRALTITIARELKRRSLDSMLVWVLAENPSRGFYEAMGGQLVQARKITIGGKPYKENGYGWRNLDSLTNP